MATAARLSRDSFVANCLASDEVGHAVRSSSDKVAGLYQVTRVDIDSTVAEEARAVGIISAKSDATTCVVRTAGSIEGVFTGLTPGKQLFVGTDAFLTHTPPAQPSSGQRLIQSVAYATASDAVVIAPGVRVWAVAG